MRTRRSSTSRSVGVDAHTGSKSSTRSASDPHVGVDLAFLALVEVKVRLVTQVEVRAIASTTGDVRETVDGTKLFDELRVCHPIAVVIASVSRKRWTRSRPSVPGIFITTTRHTPSLDGTIVTPPMRYRRPWVGLDDALRWRVTSASTVVPYRRRGGCTRPGDGDLSDDLVNRAFDPDAPDRLWCMDITEHPIGDGEMYLAVVLDAFSRRVVGWSIADHMRAELVADALQMATWRRRPPEGQTIAHADHGGQYVSWLFGARLRDAGLLGSMGSVGDCFDNSVAEAFFSSLQRELLD